MLKMNSFNFLFQARPSDFIRYPRGARCMENATAILSKFSMASDDDTNVSLSKNKCEEYCSRNDVCWGCSFSCKQSCQWYAISACDNVLESKGLIDGDISRKPGLIMQLYV